MAPNRIASTFRSNSTDAVLARIMANQENSDRVSATQRAEIKAELSIFHSDLNSKLAAIKDALDKTASKDEVHELDVRVETLEKDKWIKTGRSAAILMLLGFLSWLIPWYFASPHK